MILYKWGNYIMNLLETRIKNNLSQVEAASIINVPVRTLRRYESNENYGSKFKREAFLKLLNNYCEINESKGLLTKEFIIKTLTELFENEYKGKIDFCYLFGSYATDTAKETSDVDLYVFSSLKGLDFVGCIERIRQSLHKNVDVLRCEELVNNPTLMNEIMKKGIKIYG